MKTKKICYNCKSNNQNKTSKKTSSTLYKKIADWKQEIGLKTHYPNDEILPCKINYPKEYNTIHDLQLDKKYANRYVYYYAANKKSTTKCLQPQYATKAYGEKFKNKGVAKIDKNGKVSLKFDCPQSYYVTTPNSLHISHIHYFISNSDNSNWNDTVYTQRIICHLDKKELQTILKNNCALIINALPYKEFIKKRIPNSISLPYNIELNKPEIINYIKDMLFYYPKIKKKVAQKELKITNIPIVVYCYNTQCNASELLIDKLINIGFKDIKEYKGGVLGWYK